ncbi:MAG: bi-domain-containing oxidoreductase [Ignavibacteria bacterium]|nr:bi-domain-containing oxidoreductase [Ignavibacteria bacterium]
MEQLTQQLKSGHMEVMDVPIPALGSGQLLVRNHYSLISAGTEGKNVSDARLGLIAKARSRKKEVQQVIEMIKTSGFSETYNVVMSKLEAPGPMGYSCAGEVIAVADDVYDFKVGDYVACGGEGAYHADIVSVYKNLCVKIPKSVDLKFAAITTVASIAIQGIRQAELTFGETAVVIGLGLIGQLTMQILEASGIKAIGVDISQAQVDLANKIGIGKSYLRNRDDLEGVIKELTKGYGADAILITAGTSSLDPVEFAGAIARRKAKVVIVGAVPTGFSRNFYFKKELDLRMSCSYGPGRYDRAYEEKGIDYPYEYVRWTENRNMESYIELIERNKLVLEPLVTHVFEFEDAKKAYDMILAKKEAFVGILLKYEDEKKIADEIKVSKGEVKGTKTKIGFVGAGSFAQNALLPNVKMHADMVGVATSRGNTAKGIADKYGFQYSTGEAEKIFTDDKINTIFIATRHNLHAANVIDGLKNNKNVFVEKPLCMNRAELETISELYKQKNNLHLMVGYNRRFAPAIKAIMSTMDKDVPKAINYRINAGNMPKDHWVQDKEIGGGRIIGEVCHFIDLVMFLSGSKINFINAISMDNNPYLMDTLSINMGFDNGTIGSICYFSNGANSLPKENIEVFYANKVMVVDDFREVKTYGKEVKTNKSGKQDKGHAQEIKEFIEAIENGKPAPISFEEIYDATKATLDVIDSIKNKQAIVS